MMKCAIGSVGYFNEFLITSGRMEGEVRRFVERAGAESIGRAEG
jgi:hypothetical protein